MSTAGGCHGRFNALIRTHHILSRKKIAKIRRVTKSENCYALIRYGGFPGIMYGEGHTLDNVQRWVDTIKNLRYKDFQLAAKPGPVQPSKQPLAFGSLVEVSSVKEFGERMGDRGVLPWWRTAMGYESNRPDQATLLSAQDDQ